MRRFIHVVLGASWSILAACGDTPECDSVHVDRELTLEVGQSAELIYRTEGELPAEHVDLLVRCPRAPAQAISLFHEGFGCSSDPSQDSSHSTGWNAEPGMEYVLGVRAEAVGTYDVVARLRDRSSEEARFSEPLCTVVTTVHVVE